MALPVYSSKAHLARFNDTPDVARKQPHQSALRIAYAAINPRLHNIANVTATCGVERILRAALSYVIDYFNSSRSFSH